ncbi:hypothetical protein PS1M3_18670 [Pseudoalteromonas sp. PS1M3]|jgi:DNA-binding NtrC family response regulator|nr:hypothetical protein PS1M3_18670 [Pseudoalteromonas sp. PS1M3]
MERLVTMALQVAKSDISALITGPNGSGKECIATIIQKNSSLINQPFIKGQCRRPSPRAFGG